MQRYAMRYATAAQFAASNPVLGWGEEGFESDTGKRKVGDGVTAWLSLAYVTTTVPTGPGPGRQNLLGWSLDPALTNASSAPTSGALLLVKVIVEASGTIGNLCWGLNNSPAGCANSFTGWYDNGGNLKAQSADLSTALNAAAAGEFTKPMVSGVAASAGDVIWAAWLVGSASTAPTLQRGAANSVMNVGLGAGTYRAMVSGSGLTALPSTVTLASATKSNTAYFAAAKT